VKPLDAADYISLGASLSAGAIAIWAVREAKHAAKEQAALQHRLVSIETERERDRLAAKKYTALVARFENNKLLVRNVGAQPAYNVRVDVIGQPGVESLTWTRGAARPIPTLAPEADYSHAFVVYDGLGHEFSVSVEWDDAAGESHVWKSQLVRPS
jgi:hypothetical protein